MGRPTILRIPKGLELSPALQKSLVDCIGTYGTPEMYVDGNDIKAATFERMTALKNAFTFMLSAKGSTQSELVKRAEKARDLLIKEVDSKDDKTAEKIIGQYAQSLVDILARQFKLELDEAEKQLNRAEQYNLLHETRPFVATFSPIQGKEGYFLLQYDKPIQAFTEHTIEELKAIKQYSAKSSGQTKPIFPVWFGKLSPAVKIFLFRAKANKLSDTDIRKHLNILNRLWDENARHLDHLTHNCIKDFVITKNKNLLPHWLAELPEISQQLLSDLLNDKSSPYHFKSEIEKIENSGETIPDTFGLPAWYFFLPDYEKEYLIQSLNLIEDLRSVSLSSRLRSLPGLANGGIHSAVILDKDGKIVDECQNRYRGAHLVSRDNHAWPMSLQGENLYQNLSLLPKEPKLYVTTLISPHDSSWARAITKKHPDSWLNYLLQILFQYMATVDFVNLPVNYYGGALLPWQSDIPQKIDNYLLKLQNTGSHGTGDKEKLSRFESLLYEAKNLLNHNVESASWNAVNLRLAAIFHLIGQSLGVTFGSCVSGKDRYSVLLSYVDAMKVYKFINGHWPAFENGKNSQFNQLLMSILRTNHHAMLANLNAHGSRGLKNLKDYLNGIAEHGDKEWLAQQNQMASTNELKDMRNEYLYTEGMGEYLFRCIDIGAELCSKINEKVHAISQEEKYWKGLGDPEGIRQLQKIFATSAPSASPSSSSSEHSSSGYSVIGLFKMLGSSSQKTITGSTDPYKSRSPELVLAEVFGSIHGSLERQSYYRYPETKRFYSILESLTTLTDKVSGESAQSMAEQVYQKLDKLYDEIKKQVKPVTVETEVGSDSQGEKHTPFVI
ncbi:hypothetical protein [Legionella sp. W05-934-2]|uniref:hypothetical protein n=1 Tax=Legionella sp. W05-934-2 TaxID=1198649 RepID=UPI0034619699